MHCGGDHWDWLGRAAALKASGEPFAMVTLISAKGSTPRPAGAKMIVSASGRTDGTIGGGQLEHLLIEDARRVLAEARAGAGRYPLCFRTGQCCGGAVDAFFEVVNVGPELFLFGAGHVGQALCQTLAGTPFRVTVVDARGEWRDHAEMPGAVRKAGGDWREFVATAEWDRHLTFVAVMTHDHALDLDVIEAVSQKPARFIGLIGSETKWGRFQQRLAARGLDPDQIGRVRCPIGIARFGKAPREVAISVAAELLQTWYDAAPALFTRSVAPRETRAP